MYKYKLIATDLDGTLLNSESRLSEENRAALRALSKKGVHLSISTGRTYSEIPEDVRACKDFRYVIYANGAVVLDKASGEKMSACIPPKVAASMMDIFKDYEVHVTARNDGKCYYDGRFPIFESKEYFRIDPAHVRCVGEFGTPIENFDAFVRTLDEVEVFSIYFRDDGEQKECGERLAKLENVYVTGTSETNFEIFNSGAGKDNALLRLAEYLAIPREQTMTLGDSGNDVAMTKAAGLGLATANAQQVLLSVADGVICSNDEHVMPYVLKKYFS